MSKVVDVTVRVTVSDEQWSISARDCLDMMEARIDQLLDQIKAWDGSGRGAINYAHTEVLSVEHVR